VQGSGQLIATISGSTIVGVSTPTRAVFLNAGDYVELAGFQSSGAALNTGVASGNDLASALFVAWAHV
jgi:hypothetical protein